MRQPWTKMRLFDCFALIVMSAPGAIASESCFPAKGSQSSCIFLPCPN